MTYTVLGTDDSNTTCDCCGRSNLKCTVALRTDDGDVVFYGRTCAARATGWKAAHLDRQVLAAQAKVRQAQEILDRWSRYVSADGAIDTAAFLDNNRGMSGEIRWTHDEAAAMIRATIADMEATLAAPRRAA